MSWFNSNSKLRTLMATKRRQRAVCSLAIGATMVLATGCTSVPEQQAVERSKAVGQTPQIMRGRNYSRPALPELTESATLSDLLAYAALNSPDLEAAFHRWQATRHKIVQTTALPDPRLNYGYYIQEVETRVGPQEQRVGVSQMFPWFGKRRLRGGMAADDAEAAHAAYDAARLRLFYQVKDGFYELHFVHRAIVIAEDNLKLLQHLESVAQARFKGGAPVNGVVKAQVELSKLSDRLRTLKDLLTPVTARLNAILGRPAHLPLGRPQPPPPLQFAFTDAELVAWLAKQNPELRGLAAMIQREEKSSALARREYWPDVTLGVDWLPTGEAQMPMRDSGKDPVIATFSVNIPLWRDKLRAGVAEAEERHETAERTHVNRANFLGADLQMALYRFRDAERRVSLYRDTLIPQAQAALNVAQESYEAGKTEFLDLIDAQRLLLEFQLEAERSLATREQRLAEIEMLVGQGLDPQTNRPHNP